MDFFFQKICEKQANLNVLTFYYATKSRLSAVGGKKKKNLRIRIGLQIELWIQKVSLLHVVKYAKSKSELN